MLWDIWRSESNPVFQRVLLLGDNLRVPVLFLKIPTRNV